MEELRFPIGRFQHAGEITAEQRKAWLQAIEDLPFRMREAVAGLSEEQLNTPYRDGGWTVRQVVHHVADSHMNSYIRFKLALTEELPTIKPYEEAAWAEMEDAKHAPVEVSLKLLESLHHRWVLLIRGLEPSDWDKILPPSGFGRSETCDELRYICLAWQASHRPHYVVAGTNELGLTKL